MLLFFASYAQTFAVYILYLEYICTRVHQGWNRGYIFRAKGIYVRVYDFKVKRETLHRAIMQHTEEYAEDVKPRTHPLLLLVNISLETTICGPMQSEKKGAAAVAVEL